MPKIQFGTDGWRGIIGGDFTFDNVALCAQGLATYLSKAGVAQQGVVVGYDTRFASADFAACVARVLAGNGIAVYLASAPAPTPVISYQVLHRHAGGGVVITASHNPAAWNGFKFKPYYAGAASPEITASLEAEIDTTRRSGIKSMDLHQARSQGLIQDTNPMPSYLEQLRQLVDLPSITGAGLRIHVDAMFGAGGGYLPALLSGGNTQVEELHGHINPAFPALARPEPIEQNLGGLIQSVIDHKADVGIALDGDADRVGVVDEKGRFLTPLQVHALLALYLLEVEGKRGTLVKSLTTTSMIFRLGELYNVKVRETPVGFKYICPVMLQEDALMGGEESGGFGFQGHIPERDGILSALYFLSFMARTGKTPGQLLEHLYQRLERSYHYRRNDVTFPPQRRKALQRRLAQATVDSLAGHRVTGSDSLDGRRYFLSDGWTVVRFSGTEPLLRIYAEAESEGEAQRIAEALASFLGLHS